MKQSRRKFLQMMGSTAVTGMIPASIARALEIPADRRTGTIRDIRHVVILMQENRSFDHYFGTLKGVRGFGDPRAVRLPSGKPVWYQPDGDSVVVPFRPPVENLGLTFLPDPPHGWTDTHAAWNGGRHDQFVPNKGLSAMTYHNRDDIPFHFALADAFTICDAYHCSLMGPTDPNRYHLWTGWVGNDGAAGGPVITNAELGYDWSTYPERLERNGISWKIYQDAGLGLDGDDGHFWGWTGDPYIGNYGDNSLLYFHQFQNAAAGTPLADRAKTGTKIDDHDRDPTRLVKIFRDDVANGRLPQVSWIVAPEAYSEHPNHPANYGAWYVSQFLDALTSNPDVWSRTALFLTYDEEGGFFDHMVPPTPPPAHGLGASTVRTVNEIYPGDPDHPKGPYGLGMRVPMLVISPWSKGGWVSSRLYDHTSVIRFLEKRFAHGNPDLIESNITPWRRAVVGDLTEAFDFSTPDSDPLTLPSTADFKPADLERHDDYEVVAPVDENVPVQETGTRPARPLPYALHATGSLLVDDGAYRIEFANAGRAAAVLQVRSAFAEDAPRAYTIGSGKALDGTWPITAAGRKTYDLEVHGPNGFLRAFKGSTGPRGALVDVAEAYDELEQSFVRLTITNRSDAPLLVKVANRYTRRHVELNLDAGGSVENVTQLARSFGWYDLVVTVDDHPAFQVHLAGHLENGSPSFSDPAMGNLRLRGG